jgi:hypothetical protein
MTALALALAGYGGKKSYCIDHLEWKEEQKRKLGWRREIDLL